MYKNGLKRFLDMILAGIALIALSPLLLLLCLVGACHFRGNPFFRQVRPGRGERPIYLLKFRTMTNRTDATGKLLPDGDRLTAYGRFLRSTSLDELPSLFNILCGDLAIVGPRPQLFRDMVFMTDDQRRRHTVRAGLTGLAQVNGRNRIDWDSKLAYDLAYLDAGITFGRDMRIILQTVLRVLKRDGITAEGQDTAEDYGDFLLAAGRITPAEYDKKMAEAEAWVATLTHKNRTR